MPPWLGPTRATGEASQAEVAEAMDAARTATEAADHLRVAEASRKVRSRWARLRAAWRGE
jgi:hypothetical protein